MKTYLKTQLGGLVPFAHFYALGTRGAPVMLLCFVRSGLGGVFQLMSWAMTSPGGLSMEGFVQSGKAQSNLLIHSRILTGVGVVPATFVCQSSEFEPTLFKQNSRAHIYRLLCS